MDILKRIERMLDLPEAEKTQVMRELKSHYEEIREELIASGMEPEKADQEAARRLGDPEAIASNLTTVHCVAPWRSAVVAVLPFLTYGLSVAANFTRGVWSWVLVGTILLCGVVFTAGVIKGFRSGGRPVWLPVWTAASIAIIFGAVNTVGFVLSRQYHAGFGYLLVLPTVFLAITVMLLCWRLPSWKRAVIWIIVGGIVFLVTAVVLLIAIPSVVNRQAGLLLWRLFSVILTALWVLLALRVFALHRYGSAAQAALFIFSIRTITWVTSVFMSTTAVYRPQMYTPFMLYSTVVIAVGVPVAVLAFARASTFAAKITMLGSMLLLSGGLKAASISQAINLDQHHTNYATSPIFSALSDLFIGLAAIGAVVIYHNIRRRTEARYAV